MPAVVAFVGRHREVFFDQSIAQVQAAIQDGSPLETRDPAGLRIVVFPRHVGYCYETTTDPTLAERTVTVGGVEGHYRLRLRAGLEDVL
jgi:hypothetical protein